MRAEPKSYYNSTPTAFRGCLERFSALHPDGRPDKRLPPQSRDQNKQIWNAVTQGVLLEAPPYVRLETESRAARVDALKSILNPVNSV
jgi:hypothetical protein